MKKIILLLSCLVCTVGLCAQSENSQKILQHFIKAHNEGSPAAMTQFIQKTYHPDLLKKINLQKHLDFYQHIINEFGPLNPKIYATPQESEHKLVVHLIKAKDDPDNPNISPLNILEVEIDLHQTDANFMPRGLGLGALACKLRRD